MDIYEIDVTGEHIFAKGFGIIILFRKEKAYGYKFSSSTQTQIKEYAKTGKYGVRFDKNLQIRVYTSILAFILSQISQENRLSKDSSFKICPDFPGHEKAIIERLKQLTKRNFDYIFKSHDKKSKIQQFALMMNKGDLSKIIKVNITATDLHNSIAKKRFRKERW